ncbi:MAG: C40 family peptidase [Azovibrio sp.]|nr:C40 family peptidase [Azovibrio sp.]
MDRGIRQRGLLCTFLAALWLTGCGGFAALDAGSGRASALPVSKRTLEPTPEGREVVMYALGLIGTDYRFGGKNPEAGLDCSGMVSYIYSQATPLKVSGSAADIARLGRPVSRQSLRPGDLVFFNTQNRPRSHVGIYIGEQRFVHAPSTSGQVRIERLDSGYFASRFEEARTYFD